MYKLARFLMWANNKSMLFSCILGVVVIVLSVLVGWLFSFLVEVEVGAFIALTGGLVVLVFSYLVNETNKNSATREEMVRRCNKIEEMLHEQVDEDVGFLFSTITGNSHLVHLSNLEKMLGDRRYVVKNGKGSICIRDLNAGFFSAVSAHENFDVENTDVPRLEELWRDYQKVARELYSLRQEVRSLHVDLIRKIEALDSYVEATALKYEDLESPMKGIRDSLGRIKDVYYQCFEDTKGNGGSGGFPMQNLFSEDNDVKKNEAIHEIDRIIKQEINPVFGSLEGACKIHGYLSNVCYFSILVVVLMSSSYAVFSSSDEKMEDVTPVVELLFK
ncbi:hypothetical protein [Halomonas denitrificans]|uniref:hypothetical protein n=1 Tax=Halomonas denitrificans TaxID=370769 RepID=UPI001300A59C|nr:hypothetical protein [Halomonas denitrificans]